jgi:hypothetical protein
MLVIVVFSCTSFCRMFGLCATLCRPSSPDVLQNYIRHKLTSWDGKDTALWLPVRVSAVQRAGPVVGRLLTCSVVLCECTAMSWKTIVIDMKGSGRGLIYGIPHLPGRTGARLRKHSVTKAGLGGPTFEPRASRYLLRALRRPNGGSRKQMHDSGRSK